MEIKVNIPEKLSDITLKQWQEISDIDPASEAEFYNRRILSIIYGIGGKAYRKLKNKDVSMLLDSVTKCLNEEPKLTTKFELDGVEYGLIPNLDEISFGELTDIDTNSTKEKYNKLMSILYRPIIMKSLGKYEIEPYKGTKDLSHMPVNIALGVLAFFLTLGEQLTNAILSSLTEEEQAAARKYLLEKSGAGIVPSIPSVMETFRK